MKLYDKSQSAKFNSQHHCPVCLELCDLTFADIREGKSCEECTEAKEIVEGLLKPDLKSILAWREQHKAKRNGS